MSDRPPKPDRAGQLEVTDRERAVARTAGSPGPSSAPPPSAERERRASWLELFFDLVFVAAVAALATRLHADHSLAGLAVFAGLFVPVWWGWMGYTWYATGFDTDDIVFRLGLLAGMLAIAALSAGVNGAADGSSDAFVIAYASLFYVLAALYARTWLRATQARPLTAHLAIGNALGATLWLASLALDQSARPFAWAAGMLLLISAFAFAPWTRSADPFDASHVAERYGLFTIIVLGESIVATIAGVKTGANLTAAFVAVAGFVLAAAIWWLYFGLFTSMPIHRGFAGRFVWAQGHLLVFAGIAAAAVGVRFAIEAAAHGKSLELADRLPLGAGLAAYMAALAAIRAANHQADWVVAIRLTLAVTVVALAIAGLRLDPLSFVALIAALLACETTIELTQAPPHRPAQPETSLD